MRPEPSAEPTSCARGNSEHANGGTLFLDEIGDMPSNLQAKLLRLLEYQEVVRVGGNEPIKVNVACFRPLP